ncbi:MAG: IS1634 family transposase [Armatimonadota bacterium]
MFLRPYRRQRSNGSSEEYWALVESYRTTRGPRQRVVSYLGDLAAEARDGLSAAAVGRQDRQPALFGDRLPERVEIDLRSLRVERTVAFGGVWLGKALLACLGLDTFFKEHLPPGREEIPWAVMAQILILGRFLDPSSDLRLAEHLYGRTALADVLGVPVAKINDDRLYRALDALLPHKAALTRHLRAKGGELFGLTYDLVLYDVTSTFFEGTAAKNPSAQRGYSRDHRPDCVQVCIALVVDRSGFPLGYEVFPGNRHDSTTVQTIVRLVEKTYGRADRIWVMDRGMVSEENLAFLRQSGRRYIIGTPKALLKAFERDLLAEGWDTVREGVEVKTCAAPDGSADHFVLCRSQARQQKEQAMHARFEARIEAGLTKLAASCVKRTWPVGAIERRVGKLLGANTRAAGLFEVTVTAGPDGRAQMTWTHNTEWRDWATLSAGCYLLRSNIDDLPPADLWTAYIGLTQAEAAFRIQKSDLQLRPIWHQRLDRVKAHLLVCFLAFVLWKTLGQLCTRARLGDEPRRVLDELAQIMLVDVAVNTSAGVTIRKRCVAQPTKLQATLLQQLQLPLPAHLGVSAVPTNVVEKSGKKTPELNVNSGKITC